MFSKIFRFEIASWFNKPALYIYAVLIMAASALLIASSAGAFDGNTATVTSLKYVNSPYAILNMIMAMATFVFLLFPNIVGESIHKDYKYNVHKVMYSFPFSKRDYFFGKITSALTICLLLLLCIALGLFVGLNFPGVNKDLIGPHCITPYIHTYLVYIIPGVILFGSIVFAVVTYSRSVIAGFIAMIIIYVLQGVVDTALTSNDHHAWAALADPFGMSSSIYYTRYWTIIEENTASLPLGSYVMWNRVLWLLAGFAIFAWSYLSFRFHVDPKGWKWPWAKKQELKTVTPKRSVAEGLVLPSVKRAMNLRQSLSSAWLLTKMDLKYVLKGGPFIVITIFGLLILFIVLAFSQMIFQTKTLPLTAKMLSMSYGIFQVFIILLTVVYSGLLIQRHRKENISQLEDATGANKLSFVLSKFLTITLMQGVLLLMPMIAGIIYQISQGFFDIDLGLYIRDLFLVRWIFFIPWTLLGLFVYTVVPNFYVGLVIMLFFLFGMGFLSRIGIEQSIYKFNNGRGISYSDIAGYGRYLWGYYIYRIYWVLGGLVFGVLAYIFWRRGVPLGWRSRLAQMKQGFTMRSISALALSLVAFLSVGYYIYNQTNVEREHLSSKATEQLQVDYEKKYKHYEKMPQPRIVDVSIEAELYPGPNDFEAKGKYLLENKGNVPIDTLYINHDQTLTNITIDDASTLVKKDSIFDIQLFALVDPLQPGDTLGLSFTQKNRPNTPFSQDIRVRRNGTFLNSDLFPKIGYQPNMEISNTQKRKKYDLPPKPRMASITDTAARANTYITNCADWVNFEMTIGTAGDQIAVAPGNLIKEWEQDGRKYYTYKMNRPMLNFYNISSARYEVVEEMHNGTRVAIYYHKDHDYNLDRMMAGLKDGLDYYEQEYSPYQHDEVRILEFPRGGFAQSFANTIPFSENLGFISQVDDSADGGVDYAYAITAHELAHQWWAHQVIGAATQGSTMLSESLSEYSSLKLLERRYGKGKMRIFLKDALDKYLLNRSTERERELPLAYNENQQYIHYQKGSVVFYALSDLIGDTVLNDILSMYIDTMAFQEPPYTVSTDLVEMIRANTADSIHYFIDDNFENITLYDNQITDADYVANDDGTYTVNLTAQVVKYQTDEKGKQKFENAAGETLSTKREGKKRDIKSLPLADYVYIGIFSTEEVDGESQEKVLYLKRHRMDSIISGFEIIVDSEPREVGVDPYYKLIDRNSEDNRRKVSER